MNIKQISRDFHKNGFVIVKDIFPSEDINNALKMSDQIMFGMPYEKFLENHLEGNTDKSLLNSQIRLERAMFPTGKHEIDFLLHNHTLLDIFEACLGTSEISYCNSHLFNRAGPIDFQYPGEWWSGYHIDHDTESYLPPHKNYQKFNYVNCHVFLHNVAESQAPMQMIPGSHLVVAERYNEYYLTGKMSSRGNFVDIRNLDHIDHTNRISATATAGSVLFYSSYLIHSARKFTDLSARRSLFTATFFRRDNSWMRRSWPYTFRGRRIADEFFASAPPRLRFTFGWPENDHEIYDSNVREIIKFWYTGIDSGDL